MAAQPRYDLRPRQRSRYGVKALDPAVVPTRDDMMVDLLELRITGWLGWSAPNDGTGELLGRYRNILSRRAAEPGWTAGSQRATDFYRSTLRPGDRWLINEALIEARKVGDRVSVAVKVSLNPTRVLHHRLAGLPEQSAREALLAMQPDAFFEAALIAPEDLALAGADNALPRPIEAQQKLGPNFVDVFLEIVEAQFRRWVLEALAPASAGFRSRQAGTHLLARSDEMELRLDWANIIVLFAEVYFERRQSSARALMEHLAHTVPQAHSEIGLRRYGEDDLGGRRLGSAVVGFARTRTLHQVYYAKYGDRIRAETRYLKGVRNAVRATRCQTDQPLTELLGQVRDHAAKKAKERWSVFSAMCAEPRRATLDEAARLMALIADCAQAAGVALAPVFSALLTSGGIDESGIGGPAPRRLMDRLERAGLISRQNLNTRRRPGERRRHGLTGDWLDIVLRMKAAFDEEADQTITHKGGRLAADSSVPARWPV